MKGEAFRDKEERSEECDVPCPCRRPFLKVPTYLSPLDHVRVPCPSRTPPLSSPSYFPSIMPAIAALPFLRTSNQTDSDRLLSQISQAPLNLFDFLIPPLKLESQQRCFETFLLKLESSFLIISIYPIWISNPFLDIQSAQKCHMHINSTRHF